MHAFLALSDYIDRLLTVVAKFGSWLILMLVIVVCYDVSSRYFGVPKPFGLNSTKVQESEYWLHTYLFALLMGYTYTKQNHVRIDLIRDRMPKRIKYLIEAVGCVVFLLGYVTIATIYTWRYVLASFYEGEVSKSVIGLSHIWILKSSMPIMFVLIGLAGISQLIKSLAGLSGQLPQEKIAGTIGGDIE
ncbi:MAG: TRAP transporter small permease subunit [Hyphomicrobiales bacterium]|nr:TRAP transporter small permease subunit [Hyphomicrobiales bacterium]